MSKCENCIHEGMCRFLPSVAKNIECRFFKDKSRFVELPCKVGDKVYETDGVRIYESIINEIDITHNKMILFTDGVAFDETAIGKGIFLTKEEAEAKLKGGEG